MLQARLIKAGIVDEFCSTGLDAAYAVKIAMPTSMTTATMTQRDMQTLSATLSSQHASGSKQQQQRQQAPGACCGY